ncbi:MAG: glycosyltransferase family 2 protein [Bacteroidia bacterium]|nr:glycosyltransferase family 2 protein [Bacteroidia bacterium]
MDNALISIIVPAYNVEKYIDKCLFSICNQTFTNLEIIVINDGATDNTPFLCNEWAKKDTRIKLINQENKGLAETCNIGLKAAMGEFIGFVDSDDWIEPIMFEELFQSMLKFGSDISVCGITYISEEGKFIRNLNPKKREVVSTGNEALKYLLIDKHEKSFRWNKLFKKELFNGILYPKGKLFEDFFITHKLYAKATSISYTPKNLYYYLQRKNSILGQKKPLNEIYFFSANIERLHFINNYNGFSEKERRKLQIRTIKRLLSSTHNFHKTTSTKEYIEEKEEIIKIMRTVYHPNFKVQKHWQYIIHNYYCHIPFLFSLR